MLKLSHGQASYGKTILAGSTVFLAYIGCRLKMPPRMNLSARKGEVMPMPFDATLKDLLQTYPNDWLVQLDLTRSVHVEVIEAELSSALRRTKFYVFRTRVPGCFIWNCSPAA